jgi:glycyl-tRNA synthetase beta chain
LSVADPRSNLPGSAFLLEVGCEEIPAQMIRRANEDLRAALVNALGPLAEEAASSTAFGGPRRLVSFIEGIRPREEDREETVLGPSRSVAFDGEGRPTRAAEGFARKQGVDLGSLQMTRTPRGEVVSARKSVRGRSAVEILAEACPRVLGSMRFGKMMRWGDKGHTFVRPVHWLAALMDSEVVPFEFTGIVSGRLTWGHRFLGPGPHEIPDARDYEDILLKRGHVTARFEVRRKIILDLAAAEAASAGGTLRRDDGLLDELVFLTEHPAVILGSFPRESLKLPDEVLLTAIRHHQKYLTIQGADGRLLNAFVAVLTTDADGEGLVRRGNEWVLKARLEDARFFYEEDQKRPLEARVEDLEKVTFHARLGSYAGKISRMERLLDLMAPALALGEKETGEARLAVRLCKTDLTTGMVGEFPELQGVMGGIYARMQGHPETCSRAIEEHYRPSSPTEPVPSAGVPAAVALVDKLDTLALCFAAGLIPKGSADPFALRRAALGLLRTLVENEIPLELSPFIEEAMAQAAGAATERAGPEGEKGRKRDSRNLVEPLPALRDFLAQRLRFLMEEAGIRLDVARAALAASWSDPLRAWRRASALNELRGKEDFLALAAAAKRVRNILTQAAGKGLDVETQELRQGLFKTPQERKLYDDMCRVDSEADRHAARDDHLGALTAIASLRPVVDEFFDEVLVMDPDQSARLNRIALLVKLSTLLSREADFAEIVVEGESPAT